MLPHRTAVAVLMASALTAALAVTNQSYWIDEALSLVVAQAPTSAEAWTQLRTVSGSTLQMPLYEIYLYAWHKAFGGGEWVMRASNIPLLLLGQLAFLVFLRHRPKLALTACLLAAICPMVWLYLDEARPYLMGYAAACWLTAGIVMLGSPRSTAFTAGQGAALGFAFFALFSSSLLGAVWAACFAVAFLTLRCWKKLPLKDMRFLAVALFSIATILVFSAYYAFTWREAGRGHNLAGASILSIPFIVYEILGFSGFGPAKHLLRTETASAIIKALPALVPLAIILGSLVIMWMNSLRQRNILPRTIIAWLTALALPSSAILLIFFAKGHHPLPRHFIPALPAVIIALADAMLITWERPKILWKSTACLLPALWLGSALNLLLNPLYSKEDYRAAAQIAAAALKSGRTVWWNAADAAASIYHLPVSSLKHDNQAWFMQAPSWESLKSQPLPDLIVVSRPDVFDPLSTVAHYIQKNNYTRAHTFQGIAIFTAPTILNSKF